jgi:hypothetical protein
MGKDLSHVFSSFSLVPKMANSCFAAVPCSHAFSVLSEAKILLNVSFINFVMYITRMTFYVEKVSLYT